MNDRWWCLRLMLLQQLTHPILSAAYLGPVVSPQQAAHHTCLTSLMWQHNAQHTLFQHLLSADALLDAPVWLLLISQAEAEGKLMLAACGFPNTDTLSKHLAEKLVVQNYAETGLPTVIVRPSLITCTALVPYAGYLGNWCESLLRHCGLLVLTCLTMQSAAEEHDLRVPVGSIAG